MISTSSPSVSIVTPSYNQAAFIRDTVESVQRQTYGDITHIVVDGESDDETTDILRDYDNLQWTSEPDKGQTHAINKGFERAEGDIVGWLNSDDTYVFRDGVTTVVDTFQRTGADIVYGHALTIGPDNDLRRVHHLPQFDREKLKRHCYLIQPSVFFRDFVVKDNKLNEDREYSMDYEFWLDLADNYDWYRLDEVIAADRNHQARKIIQDAEQSRKDTNSLRRERGIDQGTSFKARQLIDKLDMRWRRIRGIGHVVDILSASPETFAFNLRCRSLASTFYTQVFRDKKEL